MNTRSGHKCFLTMVENAFYPLCPAEIWDFIADKKDSYCIPDNQVVSFFVLWEKTYNHFVESSKVFGEKRNVAGYLNTLFLLRVFY